MAETREREDEQKGDGYGSHYKTALMIAFSCIFQKQREVQQRMAKAREVSEGFSAVQSTS